MSEQKKPYHLTITDNETGEPCVDLDFDTIIGVAHLAEGEVDNFFITESNLHAIAETAICTEGLLKKIHKDHPWLDPAMKLLKRSAEIKEQKQF